MCVQCKMVVNKHHRVRYDIYIGRGSEWGNPFSHLPNTKAQFRVATRQDSIKAYVEWIITQPQLLRKLRSLKGKVLGCFCKPAACHGDILVVMANNYEYWEDYADEHFGPAA